MQITPAGLDAIYYNYNLQYQQAFDKAAPWYSKVATEAPSTTRENRYAWMGLIPRLREWVGERVVRNVAARVSTIVNKDFESTHGIERNDIEDDNLGVFTPLAQLMGQQAALWPDDLLVTAMQSTSALAYDGQPFWNASHPINVDSSAAGTFANLYTTTALSAANYNTVRAAMMSTNGEDGKPLRVTPNLLVVPPQLEKTAREIVQGSIIATVFGSNTAAAATENVLKGTADVLVIQELANEPTVWYLLDCTKPIRPVVFQKRKAPQFVSLTAPTDESVFWRKKFIYGVDARGNAGYSLPFLAARAVA